LLLIRSLNRPEQQRLVHILHIDSPVAEPALTAALLAGWQGGLLLRHLGIPAIETDALAQQQASRHMGQQHKVSQIAEAAVLTQKAEQLTMETGLGIHEGLACEDS
jgi:hypothetical protein